MFREGLRPPDPFGASDPLEELRTQDGMSLKALCAMAPVLVVFLPGFARRPLRDLGGRRRALEDRGHRLVLVHTSSDEEASRALAPHDLHYVARIADPERRLHRAFEVEEPKVWDRVRGAPAPAYLMEPDSIRRIDYGELA